ncbi:MAG: hypothetical protein AAB606_05210, partial [Patescibacteria group bacterium]
MDSLSKKILFGHKNSHTENGNFVFLQMRTPQGIATASGDAETDENQPQQREDLERDKKAHAEELTAAVARSKLSEETKQYLRLQLSRMYDENGNENSSYTEIQNRVEDFLSKNSAEGEHNFVEEIERLHVQDRSWATIFARQREVRRKIQELQMTTEGFVEIIKPPKRKAEFQAILGRVRLLNRQDDTNERRMKAELYALTQNGALTEAAAREIYETNPNDESFPTKMESHKAAIEGAPEGKTIFRRLLVIKKEEARLESQFYRLHNELNKIIERNVSKLRRKSDEGQVIKEDGKAIGITLEAGTKIEFKDMETMSMLGRKQKATIDRVVFEQEYTIRDKDGNPIDKGIGIPIVYLLEETPAGMRHTRYTIGRFKKWADACDARETISSLSAVEKATGLTDYDIKIEKGMKLSYPRRIRNEHSQAIETVIENIVIEDIDSSNQKIKFDRPILYQPGFETFTDYDYRNELSFGEFAKWWHRYEVEKSVSLDELRRLLETYCGLENKRFGIESANNPPIGITKYEGLKYPDEEGGTFKILEFSGESITVGGLGKMAFSEFLYWVKNNHVRKHVVNETPEKAAEKTKIQEGLLEKVTADEAGQEAKRKYGEKRHEEMIAYGEELKSGSSSPLERLQELWFQTQFLSFKDLFNMVTEVGEFIKRKHETRSKTRYGTVGARLPWVLGTEFERVRQAASNEEVGKYKEAMEKWGVAKIKKALYSTTTKDVAKACVLVLVAKGEMRWDDHELWTTLNKLTDRYTLKGSELYIPPPEKMPPGESGEDLCRGAIDELWGTGQASEWFQENISHYNSNKNNFEYKFKQLENDPKGTGGPYGELKRMLKDWREGKYVNAQEYEAMLDGALKYGKMTAEKKMFFIIAGCLSRQGNEPHGETLMHMDRMGELNSKYLNAFPLLDFLTQVWIFDPTLYDAEKGVLGKKRKLNLNDYMEMKEVYFKEDFEDGKPGAQFSRFLWEVMLMNEEVRTRISKGIRSAENMDHDDAHLYIPPTTPTEIDGLTASTTGQKKFFTNAGYANGYAGFNQYLKSLSYSIEEETQEEDKLNKISALRDGLYAFVRYDGILDNRFKRSEKDHRARLDERHYDRSTVVDEGACILRDHQTQLHNLIIDVGVAYGEDWSWLYKEKFGFDSEGEQQQQVYERKIEELGQRIGEL